MVMLIFATRLRVKKPIIENVEKPFWNALIVVFYEDENKNPFVKHKLFTFLY